MKGAGHGKGHSGGDPVIYTYVVQTASGGTYTVTVGYAPDVYAQMISSAGLTIVSWTASDGTGSDTTTGGGGSDPTLYTYTLQTPEGQCYSVTVQYPRAQYEQILASSGSGLTIVDDPALCQTADDGGGETDVIYRFIVDNATRLDPGATATGFETGANYPGCSRTNTAACQPLHFETMAAVLTYCADHGETPVLVQSAEEAWEIVEGTKQVDPSQIVGALSDSGIVKYLAIGALAYFLLFRKRG